MLDLNKKKRSEEFTESDKDNMVMFLSFIKQADVWGGIIKSTNFPYIQMQINGCKRANADLLKTWNAHISNMHKQMGVPYTEDEFWDFSAHTSTIIRAFNKNPQFILQAADCVLHPEKYPEMEDKPELQYIENNEN
jgi:hypothetical protein